MRICLISREYPPDTGWGGIGAYTFQHAQALKEAGHDVEVISLTKKDAVQDLPPSGDQLVPVHRAVWGNLLQELPTVWISAPYSHFVLKSCLALWRKFLEVHAIKPFDVLEAPEHLAEALFPALTRVCPLVVRLHTPHSKFIREGYHNLEASFDHRLVSILERTAMLEADLLSSPSVDLASYVAFDTGVDLSSIQIVRNPVDTKRFCPDGERAIAKSTDDELIVFFAGRLEERKGVHYLVDAIPAVLKRCPNVRFVIVGADTNTGPGKTSVLAELNSRLAASGSSSSVRFINHVALAEMPAHYRSADICVVPSLYENAPYTVLEAQSTGKPVIGTSGGGSPEYVAHGVSGLVVPPRDSAALAAAILELATDETRRSEMGKIARERSLELFEKKVIAQQAIKSYELAIQKFEQDNSALYKKAPEQSLLDFAQLLYSYHLGLCDLIYRHSLTYRVKYWTRNLLSRPRLYGAKILLAFLDKLGTAGGSSMSARAESLRSKIAVQDKERDRLIVEKLIKDCQINLHSHSTPSPETQNKSRQDAGAPSGETTPLANPEKVT